MGSGQCPDRPGSASTQVQHQHRTILEPGAPFVAMGAKLALDRRTRCLDSTKVDPFRVPDNFREEVCGLLLHLPLEIKRTAMKQK